MTTEMTERPTGERSPGELVAAARRRDSDAYAELIGRYENYVWSIVRGYRLSHADAHDAVQMTWLRLVENLDRVRDPERIGYWLATTAGRECLRLKRLAARETGDAEEHLAERPDDRFPAPEAAVVDELMATALWEHVAALPADGRQLLWSLTRNETPAYAEFSRRTGMPVGSIGPTRGRYLRRLRGRLEAAGLGAEAWR